MSLTLHINGSLGLTFIDIMKTVVSDEKQKEIEDNLESGKYVINLHKRQVQRLNNFKTIAYFDFEVYENTEYEFEVE